MKHSLKLALFIFAAALLTNCKKPAFQAGLNFNQEILKYNVAIQFCDAGDTTYLPEKEIFVKIAGRDAERIYEYAGTKNFKVLRGLLNVGLDPKVTPTIAEPISFIIEAYGPDYLPVKVPVIIDGTRKLQRVLVTLVDLKKPPKGVSVVRNNLAVDASGTLINTEVIATPITSSTPEFAKITIPAGTQFLDNTGAAILPNGNSVEMTTVFFSSRTAYAMNSFPNGSVMADSVRDGTDNYAGFQQSAGMVYVEMTLGGQDVKLTSQLMEYDVVMDPAYISAATNAPIASGEIIPVWNFDYSKKRWERSRADTLQFSGGTLRGVFHSDELKYNSIGWMTRKCAQNTSLTFNNGLFVNTTYLIDIFKTDGDPRHPVVAGMFVDVVDGQSISNVPMPEGPVTIKVYENRLGNSQYNYFTRSFAPLATTANSPCGNNVALTITPSPDQQAHFFNVLGYCPNGYFYVFPTIPTYYKKENTKANYSLLGSTHIGQFGTTNIRINDFYHFIWVAGDDLYTKDWLIDSSTYTRVIPVPETMPTDTLRNMWCFQ